MGASLSQQEQLFVELRWQDLLENVMEADMAEQMQLANGEVDRKNAAKGFRVSFNELQGFLSVLEHEPYGSGATTATTTSSPSPMSPAFSQICERLTVEQLHSPVIVLMVHATSWWAGAIDDATLTTRMDTLCGLVSAKVAALTGQPDLRKDVSDIEDDGKTTMTTVDRPRSRRTRLLNALRRRLGGSGGGQGNSGATRDDGAMAELQLDTLTDLITLFSELLSDRAESASEATAVVLKRASQARRSLFDSLAELANSSKRPMVSVALCFLLAVFADRTAEAILYAEDGVAQLRQIAVVLSTNAEDAKRTEQQQQQQKQQRGPRKNTQDTEMSPDPAEWGLVRQLEASLLLHQYELDATQAVGHTGRDMAQSMQTLAQSRLQLSRVPLPDMSASERWRYGMSQYVGQRHVWDVLRQHFLSAGLFDTEKPTVMVFFGPSGYGKSEMAKRLASVLHACPVSDLEPRGKLVHIHMPSFCTKDSIYSLVDPPAAHVGDGILLSALLKEDDAVVVLDEFEKSTADAIQNLWLSAFQKNGTLRSLKKADRCVSTVRTTFVLTCNTSAGYIDARAGRYLAGSADDRRTLRDDFVRDCRETFQKTLGDPFVNRVDYFLPFVPYTREERTQFVEMQLERLLTHQKEKGRTVFVTPRFVKVLVDELKTFHASTIEEIVRPLIVRMAACGYDTAVLTVLTRASTGNSQAASRPGFAGISFVVLPAYRKKLPNGATVEWTLPDEAREDEGDAALGNHVPLRSWEDVKGGTAALALWEATARAPADDNHHHHNNNNNDSAQVEMDTVGQVRTPVSTTATTAIAARVGSAVPAVVASEGAGVIPIADAPLEVELELQKAAEKQLKKETEREKALLVEVERLKQTIVEKDKEIVTLKEKIVMLQKALAVMMCMVVCCCFVMAMVIGLKLTLLLVAFMLFLMYVVLGVPLRLLLGAVWALFQFLGPAKSAIIVAIMALWVYRAAATLVTHCR